MLPFALVSQCYKMFRTGPKMKLHLPMNTAAYTTFHRIIKLFMKLCCRLILSVSSTKKQYRVVIGNRNTNETSSPK